MKIKKGLIKRQVADKWIVVPVEEMNKEFNGMIELNSTSSEIWDFILEGLNKEEIAEKLTEKYLVEYEVALKDVEKFIKCMEENDFLE